ncbi:hypothetical protein [Natronobacterium gregoryi]|uniref:Uncharacterized protein n=2 Tax=Natronobacterium gregoryi TaxID=44930 RepID=L0AKR0_NATGS|nr:hypothetical protein [Natronobacterium gregoryi]AFZ73605.1 hypothetical protein Natgr_2439 [Natronobacterium gregoryi SP2]ELY67887.1 hypothetical protein C490_10345 [Natronobacterium gregoryi SP2]SFJ34352.1 hypothetical protein SAMN05443661_12332 [Natronobacterium gregoryi]
MWNPTHHTQPSSAANATVPTLEEQVRSLLDSAFAGVFSPAQEEHYDC